MSNIDLQRCEYELTPTICIFKPPELSAGLKIGMTLKAPAAAVLEQSLATDTCRLTVEQYAKIAQIPVDSLQTVKQVHSDRAIVYAGGMPQIPPPEADVVIITDRKGYGGVFVADCLAVVLFSPKQQLCAAVHAGWRGALQHIGSKTAAALSRLGAEPNELAAVLVVGIGVASYRVGEELLLLFDEQGHDVDAIFREYPDGWHLDLRQTVACNLVGLGIDPRQIYDSGLCSYTESGLLWSFRRDRKQSLRNLVFCGWQGDGE